MSVWNILPEGGFRPRELVVWAGGSSGKSLMATQMQVLKARDHAVENGVHVVFSPQMTITDPEEEQHVEASTVPTR